MTWEWKDKILISDVCALKGLGLKVTFCKTEVRLTILYGTELWSVIRTSMSGVTKNNKIK